MEIACVCDDTELKREGVEEEEEEKLCEFNC
jgi:hypothetical protein